MKKILFIMFIMFLSAFVFPRDEGFHAYINTGLVFPESDMGDNYSGRFVFGGGTIYAVENNWDGTPKGVTCNLTFSEIKISR